MTRVLLVGYKPESVDYSDPDLPLRSLHIFEALINAIHKGAPKATIAFNTKPEDTADAAGRWLHRS